MLCLPMTLLKVSDHSNVLPAWTNSPSKLFPRLKPPPTTMFGTPSRLAPRPEDTPQLGCAGPIAVLDTHVVAGRTGVQEASISVAGGSVIPVKQTGLTAALVQEFVV